MRFIFKMMVWGFIALLILPSISPVEDEKLVAVTEEGKGAEGLYAKDAMILAMGVANDVRGLCIREPALCEIGQRVVISAIERARDGAIVVGTMVEDHRAKQSQEDALTTGSIAVD